MRAIADPPKRRRSPLAEQALNQPQLGTGGLEVGWQGHGDASDCLVIPEVIKFAGIDILLFLAHKGPDVSAFEEANKTRPPS